MIRKPLGFQQITSLSSAAALTVPAGAQRAVMVATGQSVRWRDDGTDPTATVGVVLPTNTVFEYVGDLAAIKVIEATASAVLNVAYYAA